MEESLERPEDEVRYGEYCLLLPNEVEGGELPLQVCFFLTEELLYFSNRLYNN